MARILILIGGHLCTAPRPQKEADTLAAAGHEVTVAGVWFEAKLVKRDLTLLTDKPWTFQPVLDFRPGHVSRFGVRLQALLVRQLYQRFQVKSSALLGYGVRNLLRFAQTYRADLTIVHSEAGLWVGQQLVQKGYLVGVDFEDWFSQDLLPSACRSRPVEWIAELEGALLRDCRYRLTTSQAMAQALANHFKTRLPTVVYNVFPTETSPLTTPLTISSQAIVEANVRLHWFSQTIGPGRGLELLFEALSHLTMPVDVYLRGNCSASAQIWLAHQIPVEWINHIFIQPTVPNAELPACIAENDIGLALEQTDPPSRNLTVTNKLFQYIQSGLAVIATDTAGQREIFQQTPDIGRLVNKGDAIALAAAIEDLVRFPVKLQAAKKAALKAAQSHFCWEIEKITLLAAAEIGLQASKTGFTQLSQEPSPYFLS